MNLNLNELSLPTHILLALQGKLSAGNNINSAPLTTRAKPLNSQPLVIALTNSVNAIDSPYYEFEAHTLEGDNVHIQDSE